MISEEKQIDRFMASAMYIDCISTGSFITQSTISYIYNVNPKHIKDGYSSLKTIINFMEELYY